MYEELWFTSPPMDAWMHTPLNYPFFIIFAGKALKDVIDYVKDIASLSYEIGTAPADTQTSLTYMYREWIVHHGHAYESIDAQPFAEAAYATRLRETFLTRYHVYLWLKVVNRSLSQ